MNNKDTRRRVDEIYDEINRLTKEKEEIQNNCSHDSYKVGDWYWRIAASYPARICDHCDSNIGEPSEDELREHREATDHLRQVTIGTYKKDN